MATSADDRRRAWTVGAWQRWALSGCAVDAAVWLGAMTYAAGGPQGLLTDADGTTALLLAWPLLPSVLMAGVVVLAAGTPRPGPWVAAGSVALLLAASVTSVLSVLTSDSSTAGLGFFTLPLIGVGITALSGLVVVALAPPPP